MVYNDFMEKEVDGVLLAAHELKAPLAVLRQLAFSFGEMEPINERIRNEMISVSERAMRQVNDLTKVRRLEDGLFELEPVAVCALCDEVRRELNHLFSCDKKGIRVKYSNRSKLVTANWELLYSVIYNFLLNAMHYSRSEECAELTVGDTRGKVKVSVRDYGPALPLNIWRELKRGYIQKPTSIAMRPGSSGLGLFIASSFSQYMGAEIGAIRHRNGTSFFVELPISKQASLFSV